MSDDDRLEILLDRWEESVVGERPTPEELCRECPELLEPLRRRLNRLELLGSFIQADTLIDGPAALKATRDDLAGARYVPERFLARGGLGEVFVALDDELKREVALKRQRRDRWFTRSEQARFVAEAEITGRLEHPGVVPIYALGRDVAGHPYYVMRLIRGHTLEEAIVQFHRGDDTDAAGRDLKFQKLLRQFLSICQTIAYAHSRGVIHRDIKPRNIMLGEFGEALVVDWGLARVLREGSEGSLTPEHHAAGQGPTVQTVQGEVKGSPAYMSPEQAAGESGSPASDVYSLGATLFHLLTGSPPVDEDSLPATLAAVRAGRVPAPRQVLPSVPPALEAVCLKAMSLKPADRYTGAQMLAGEVERWLADEPVHAFREPWTARARRWFRRHHTLVAASVVALFVALAGLGALAAQQHHANSLLTEANEKERSLRSLAQERREETRRHLYIANLNVVPRARAEGQAERVLDLLGALKPEAGQEDLRGFEWGYLWRISHADRLTLKGHTDWVTAVAFAPGGRRLASVSLDGTARVWDLATGKELLQLHNPGRGWSLALSPDGKLLACACEKGVVVVWDVDTRKQLHDLRGHEKGVTAVCFSSSGNLLASAGHDRSARVWNASTGQQLLVLADHGDSVSDIAFSPDGDVLASASAASDKRPNRNGHGEVRLWDSRTGKLIRSLGGHALDVISVGFSPDGKRLASASMDGEVRLWNPATGEQQASHRLPHKPARLAFSPDGKFLALPCWDRITRLLDAVTAAPVLTLVGHEAPVRGVAFSPDSKTVATGSADGTVKVWDLSVAEENHTLAHEPWRLGRVTSVAFSPDSSLLASADLGGEVRVWDPVTRKKVHSMREQGSVQGIAFSPDGKHLAAAGNSKALTIWDLAIERRTLTLSAPADQIAVAYSPDSRRLASAGADSVVRLWNVATGKEEQSLRGHEDIAFAVAFSSDKQHLASGSKDGTVRVWDLATGRVVHKLQARRGHVYCVAYSPDGKLLAAGAGTQYGTGEIRVWDAATGALIWGPGRHSASVCGVCFSSDGRRLISGAGDLLQLGEPGEVRVWDVATGQELLSFRERLRPVVAVAFSPDGRRLAAGCVGNFVKLWNAGPLAP